MAASGVITFTATHNESLEIANLGSGTYDHIGFFGANGVDDAIIVGNWQDSTWIVDASGNRDSSVWGELMNCKYIDSTHVETSGGITKTIQDMQTEAATQSGTLRIAFSGLDGLTVHTYNARLYVYDNTQGSYYTGPDDVTVNGFEIDPSGQNSATEWSSMSSKTNGIIFVDHSEAQRGAGFPKGNIHEWWCGISASADAVGFLDDFDFVFEFQFA